MVSMMRPWSSTTKIARAKPISMAAYAIDVNPVTNRGSGAGAQTADQSGQDPHREEQCRHLVEVPSELHDAVDVTFVVFVYGVMQLGWDFDQMSALFFAMGILAGLIGGLGTAGTAQAFVTGFTSMANAAMLIGFARAIFVVLDQGRIIDTIVNALVTPLQALPVALSALGMMVVQAAVHGPVPSVSGQAVLTMPVLVPMSDLIGLSRQVVVLAYQYGAGLTELITPTNGALMAVTAAAGVKYGDWLKFAVPVCAALLVLRGIG